MAKYHIVVHDPDVELTQARKRGHTHEKRKKGDRHADAIDETCPSGLPNCRNCGDPDHADDCAKAGHCPHCGTRHGIAPDAVLKRHGYRLEPAE